MQPRVASDQSLESRDSGYIGRFAPSPTGPLHFGSLVAAVGSYLQARVAQGRWLVRIEDIDTPRVVPGAADNIIQTLAAFGFEWHGAIERQSQRHAYYEQALESLRDQQWLFECSCSRSAIAAAGSGEEPRYPGTCRNGVHDIDQATAVRLRVEPQQITFHDAVQGHVEQDVAATVGDFVLKRRDGLHAYHLVVVVDDVLQQVTEVVRGADLLDSTPRQLLLYTALRAQQPRYVHLPLALDAAGKKLSKSSQSLPIESASVTQSLWRVLAFLQQAPPQELFGCPLAELWTWAQTHWNIATLQGIKSATAPAADNSSVSAIS